MQRDDFFFVFEYEVEAVEFDFEGGNFVLESDVFVCEVVDGVLERFSKELGMDFASIVSTGNAGKQILDFCRHEILHDENLLLKGLGIIYKKNSK